MTVDRTISLKIKAISFLAICAVIAWHSDCGSRIEHWFIPWFTLWSVPWFFLVSGFFFFESLKKYSVQVLALKKMSSLFVPYVIWCLLGWCMWRPDLPETFGSVVCALFGVTPTIFPLGNWPLWYTRALLIYMSLGMILFSLLRRLGNRSVVFVLFAIGLLGFKFEVQRLGIAISPGGSPMFFLAGAALSWFDVKITRNMCSNVSWVIIVAFFVLASLVKCVGEGPMMGNLSIACAIVGLWFLFDHVRLPLWLQPIFATTSIVYFFHGPFIFCVRDLIQAKWGSSLMGSALDWYYCGKCIFFPLVSVGIALLTRRLLPRCYAVLSGGR